MSKNFDKIKDYFEKDFWTIDMVWNTVGKALGINEDEYKIITKINYPLKEITLE